MANIHRIRILDVPLDAVDLSSALEYVEECIRNEQKRKYILAVNAEKIMTLRREPELKKLFEKAALLLPDGIGALIAAKWILGLNLARVTGIGLMGGVCDRASKKGYKIFIYGGKEGINRDAVSQIERRYPGIRITGRSHGYVGENQMDSLVKKINESQADILFIALGSPKQEFWIQKYSPHLNVKVYQGIGGSLDVLSGQSKGAPSLIQKMGLEWLYRLIKEPKRIRRQIVYPRFLFEVMKEKFMKKRGIS